MTVTAARGQSQYIEGGMERLSQIARSAGAATDPHHRAILENYLEHVALEYAGRTEEILDAARTVAHPVYHVKLDPIVGGGDTVSTYAGVDGVRRLYARLQVSINHSERLAVADWGFASQSINNFFVTGDVLVSRGMEVDDPSSQYAVAIPQAMFWTYDASAKLLGEDLYSIGTPTITKVAMDDLVTFEMRTAMVQPFLPVEPGRGR